MLVPRFRRSIPQTESTVAIFASRGLTHLWYVGSFFLEHAASGTIKQASAQNKQVRITAAVTHHCHYCEQSVMVLLQLFHLRLMLFWTEWCYFCVRSGTVQSSPAVKLERLPSTKRGTRKTHADFDAASFMSTSSCGGSSHVPSWCSALDRFPVAMPPYPPSFPVPPL